MIKRPFLTFVLIVGTLIMGVLWFVQSPQFARIVKMVASRYLPRDLGINGDFTEISVKMFPPGFSVQNPKLTLRNHNVLRMPGGSSIVARRIDFSFSFFQIFSGDIGVHEITISDGAVQLVLDPSSLKKKATRRFSKPDFHWDELLQVHAEGIALKNVNFNVKFLGSTETIEGSAAEFRWAQWIGRGGLGYSINLDLRRLKGKPLKDFSLPESINRVYGEAYANALGLHVETLFIENEGVEVSTSGQLNGNLLDPKALVMDGKLNLKGDISQILKMYQPHISLKPENLPKGYVSFEGKVGGNLQRVLETMHVQGLATVRNFEFQSWKADSVQLEAKWDASPSGGELYLKQATIVSQIKPRVGGNQPGSGGKIELGPARWNLSSTSAIQVPMRFEHVHLHWLAAPVIKKVYPLDFRFNGTVFFTFTPPAKNRSWQLQVKLNNWVEKFQLDNQRYNQTKPLSKIFEVPRLNLEGMVMVDPVGIHLVSVFGMLPHSKVHVHGKIDFKTGYDFSASGTVNFEDVGQIAENDIRGQGNVNLHIHGPTSRTLVDIDADVKDGSYLGLFFGDAKGRITWDDDPSQLLLSHVRLKKKSTLYSLDGVLDFGHPIDTVKLEAKADQGDIQDFIQIFSKLTRSLSWFPHALNGPVSGEIEIGGGINLNQLQIQADLHGTNWEYWGEKFKTVHMVGGYDRGKYFIKELDALKRVGSITGRISYDANRNFDWDFRTHHFTLIDLDHVAQLDVPIRGKLDFESSGKGPEGSLNSFSQLSLAELKVRGLALPPSNFTMKTQGGKAEVQGVALGGESELVAEYDFDPKNLSYIQWNFHRFDYSPLLLLINPTSMQDGSLAGTLTGGIDISFHSGLIERSTGSMNISEFYLARSDSKFQLVHPISIRSTDGSFNIYNLEIQGKHGVVDLELKSTKGQLDGTLTGGLDTSIVKFFTPLISQTNGIADLDFVIGGKIKEPTFLGQIEFDGGSVHIASLDSPFENITGTLQLRQNILSVQNVQADVGGGKITVDGGLTLYSDRYPGILLNGQLTGPKLNIFPFQYIKVNGDFHVQGDEPPYMVNGTVVVDSALSKEKMLNRRKTGEGLKVMQYAPPPTQVGETNAPKFKLNIAVSADRGIMIENDLFRGLQTKAKLTLVNTLDAPGILGSAEVIQGDLIFKDHVFHIQSGTARFDNPTLINPTFDLNANSDVNGTKIQMYATGRVPDKIKIEFTSNPAMQESEILSLLAVGLTSADTKKLNANDINTMRQGEAASLVLHSLDFNRELEDKTGFQLQLDENVSPLQGTSAFRPQSQADTMAAPQITIRKKISNGVSLSAGSTVGVGTNKTNLINLDFMLNKNVSFTGVFNNYSTFGITDSQAVQNSYGLDLKFQKRFK